MILPSWLREEIPEAASALRLTMSGLLVTLAVIVVDGIVRGETEATTAYPVLAFISSGLLGFISSGLLGIFARG